MVNLISELYISGTGYTWSKLYFDLCYP